MSYSIFNLYIFTCNRVTACIECSRNVALLSIFFSTFYGSAFGQDRILIAPLDDLISIDTYSIDKLRGQDIKSALQKHDAEAHISTNNNSLLPLQIGNEWQYEDSSLYNGGIIYRTSKVKIYEQKTIQFSNKEESVYITSIWAGLDNSLGTLPISYLLQDSEGIWELEKRFYVGYGEPYPLYTLYTYPSKNYILKQPYSLGHKWKLQAIDKNVEEGVSIRDVERMICGVNQKFLISSIWYDTIAICSGNPQQFDSNFRFDPSIITSEGSLVPVRSRLSTVDPNHNYSVLFYVPNLGLVAGIFIEKGQVIWRCELTTSKLIVATESDDLPKSITLSQNYPNPFNPSTTFTVSLPKSANVSLKIFDMLGREVATLWEGLQENGKHSISFDGSKLASGTYLARLEVGNEVRTQIITLNK